MVTLSYAPEFCPEQLVPEHMQLFMRSLRKKYPAPLRFYGVGEYGELRGRPHFHIALFGLSILDGSFIDQAWGMGNYHMAELNRLTAQYLCGYVTKKLNKKDDAALKGKHPEFARMSLRPGIGALAIQTLRESLAPQGDVTLMSARGDVPETLRTGGKLYPLGRYLRGKLRESMGWEGSQPDEVKKAFQDAYLQRTPEEVAQIEARRSVHYDRAHARVKIEKGKRRL